ncbi:MAG: hypothetical protein V4739_04025 [Pseudomonadota bacterium]
MATVTDSRSSDRRTVAWRAKILLPQGQVVEARATDAGVNGLGVLSGKQVVFDSVVQLALQVPVHGVAGKFHVVTGKARVVFQVLRGNEYQLGLEWVQLEPAMRQALEQCLEKINPQQRTS